MAGAFAACWLGRAQSWSWRILTSRERAAVRPRFRTLEGPPFPSGSTYQQRLGDRHDRGGLEQFGKIDVLVNDAGIIGGSQWWERETPSDEDWAQVYAVNVRGMVITSEIVSENMKARNYGKIINIASIAARQGSPDIPHYSTSKAAVVSWTQSNAAQLAPHNINVNAICPGLLWTPMFEALVKRRANFGSPGLDSEELAGRELFEKIVEETIPMKKEQTPEDIVKMTAFLASDDAHNITGQAIKVDGGRRMN